MHCFTMPRSNLRNQVAPIVPNPNSKLFDELLTVPQLLTKVSEQTVCLSELYGNSAGMMIELFKRGRGERSSEVSLQS